MTRTKSADRKWAALVTTSPVFDANGTNLESWPPGNSTNFDAKSELPQGATQAGSALAGLKGPQS